jgi:hypothetical protein
MPAAHRPRSLLDEETIERAFQIASPVLEQAARDRAIGQSGVFHVVVLDPMCTPENATFEEAILAERSYGKPRKEWEVDFAAYARAKARVSWHARRDSHAVQALAPQLRQADDTPLWGGVYLDGLVVAASGAEPQYDEAMSGMVALLIRALLKGRAGSPS